MNTQLVTLVKQCKALVISGALISALATSLSAHAGINNNGVKLVNGDGSNKSAVCIAATVSKTELAKQMTELDINATALESFNCNGLTIQAFAQKYSQGQPAVGPVEEVKVFAFVSSTKQTVANLCVAAATSNDTFKAALKKTNLVTSELDALSCNGRSIKMFAKKNGNRRFRM